MKELLSRPFTIPSPQPKRMPLQAIGQNKSSGGIFRSAVGNSIGNRMKRGKWSNPSQVRFNHQRKVENANSRPCSPSSLLKHRKRTCSNFASRKTPPKKFDVKTTPAKKAIHTPYLRAQTYIQPTHVCFFVILGLE